MDSDHFLETGIIKQKLLTLHMKKPWNKKWIRENLQNNKIRQYRTQLRNRLKNIADQQEINE